MKQTGNAGGAESASTAQWDIDEARRIVLNALGSYSASVYLFGSRATGTMGRFSDIDIAILPEQPLPEGLLASIREKLAESHIIYNVDVVDLSLADNDFRSKVIKEGVLWKG